MQQQQQQQELVRVGQHVLNLRAVASAHWEGRKLFVYLVGGRFTSFTGDAAELVWGAVSEPALDLAARELTPAE